MKKYSVFIKMAFLMLIFFNIASLWSIWSGRKQKMQLDTIIRLKEETISRFQSNQENLLFNFSLTNKYQNENIDYNIILQDENDSIIRLKQLVDSEPKLIFKYSTLNCQVCIDEQITLLKKASERIGVKNIMIITNYTSLRELSQFVRLNQIEFKVLNLKSREFDTYDISFPYYFILDKSFLLKQLFIPIKGDTALSQHYLVNISERFF